MVKNRHKIYHISQLKIAKNYLKYFLNFLKIQKIILGLYNSTINTFSRNQQHISITQYVKSTKQA